MTDPLNAALYLSSLASNYIIDELPETDSVMELKQIMAIQMTIIHDYLDGRIIYAEDIRNYCVKCEEIIQQFERDEVI